jgi:outer membrane protein OmpA-like peptidoglycan-associated protein/tetratricopeptide (TPR) repeat protein
MKKIFFVSCVSLLTMSVNAQFVYDYLKAADNYYKKGDYASAAEYYEKFLTTEKDAGKKEFNPYSPQNASSKKSVISSNTRETVVYKLAESYRLLNFPSKAEPYYKEANQLDQAEFPLAQYHLAAQLRALGKYAEAKDHFNAFLARYTNNDEYKRNAERELQNLQFIESQLAKKDLKYFTVNKAPGELNSTGASYAPTWLNTNTLLFTSTRPENENAKVKTYTNRIYQAEFADGNLGAVAKTDMEQEKDMEQGVTAVSPDGNTIYLTKWHVARNQRSSMIYKSVRKDGNKWSDPEKLDAAINVPGANTQQPYITSDGKYLVYSSDRSGGQGGYDLWYTELTADGKTGSAMNMGTAINTPYDEQAAFYHDASQSLIFSSNGRVGMGGFDFFQSKGAFGNWQTPVNLGYPVNSVKDDIYFVSRGTARNILEDVMMSSDRDAACCLELFHLKKIRPLRQLSGRVVSCDPSKPLTGATVTIMDTVNNKVVMTKTLGPEGSYSFTLEDYQPLKVSAEATGYISNSIHVGTPADMEEESMVYPELCLLPEPPKVNETFVVENVYYDFNKADLKPESFPALDEIVRMLNFYPNMEIELSAHTDSKGTNAYNQKLSEARARSVVEYLVSKGIARERLQAKGYGETMPIEPNTINGKDNPEGREKNRRTEFKVLKNE